jgi:predicted alpha/beta-fold hydrolase
LDLDWIKQGSKNLIILSHGLEGSSTRPYIIGGARKFHQFGWDVMAWNCRSCSGEMNKQRKMYHHAASDDLEDVVNHALSLGYTSIFMGGYSLGGSLTVKFLGSHEVPKQVKGGVVVSVPFSIKGSVLALSKKRNSFYRNRFLSKLKFKVRLKSLQYPDIPIDGLDEIKTFEVFDTKYTAPLHGFKDAEDFYQKASAGNYLQGVNKPLLIINAINDPFLNDDCYPRETASASKNIQLEMPEMGGHVGFLLDSDRSWIDERMLAFVRENS